jgi:hypothetical protein
MDPVVLQKTVESFVDFLLKYFVALAAVGAFSMALIEFWKKLRDLRARYQACAVTRWLITEKINYGEISVKRHRDALAPQLSSAYAEMIELTCGVSSPQAERTAKTLIESGGSLGGFFWLAPRAEHALFSLDLDRLLGHIQDAADMALNNPYRYPGLFLFLTHGASAGDVRAWLAQADALPKGKTFDREAAKERADLYARLHQTVKRKLDAFQLYTGFRWVNWNQLWSNVVGAVVMFVALLWIQHSAEGSARPLHPAALVLLSLLGGMLAPIAKDIVVALQKVRQGG